MKRNKTEQRIFEAANRLTPEPPAFSEIEKKVDWREVASKSKADKRKPSWILPVSIGGAICSIIAVVIAIICLPPRGSEYYGGGDERPAAFGEFVTKSWRCSDPSIDLSSVSLTISTDRVVSSNAGIASLFDEDGVFVCSASFAGEPFSSFEYSPLRLAIGQYCGNAVLMGSRFDFAMSFSPSKSKTKTIDITFGAPSSSPYYGNLILCYAE